MTHTPRPTCALITGRPGSGKTTLSRKLGARLHLPVVSRDRLKEGYVYTFGAGHDQLPSATNGVVNAVFFDVALALLRAQVSVIVEAAFQPKNWDLVVPSICAIAELRVIVCELDAETCAKRRVERGLAHPERAYYHGDRVAEVYQETGQLVVGGAYARPEYETPTLSVDTARGYRPDMEAIARFVTAGR